MVAIPLTSGAYSSESYIANSQRAVNVFSEKTPPETHPPFPTLQIARPGLLKLGSPPVQGFGRCLYRATNGEAYAVVNQTVYFIDPDLTFNPIGNLISPVFTPVYMSDDGFDIVLVDGSAQGYDINMLSRAMLQIGDPNFLGSDRVDYLDTFLIFNKPNTNEWYCTESDQILFNGVFVGIKTAWPDNILCVIANEREAILFGSLKSEPWYNAGSVPFPFQLTPGIIIEQGCAAKYSPQKMDTFVYWLSQTIEGARMVMRMTSNNVAQRISTHAIDNEFLTYPRVDDAIGSVYQIKGHSFYSLHFPTADRTWVYDAATEQWWEDAWFDVNGIQHRARGTFTTYAYGKNLALDWATGALYQIDDATFTDDGNPIPWIRSFPHYTNELKYAGQSAIVADVATGMSHGTGENGQFLSPWSAGFSSGFGPITQIPAPTVNLRISRDGGNKYGNNRPHAGLSSGRYRSIMRWRGTGIARDWVLEFSSTAEMAPAIQGAYIDPIGATA